tara:strand:+ start:5552 stop:5929 length:378 start_codon:yes stop_codon:yes gene_type:complete
MIFNIKKIWTWIKHYWYIPAVLVYTIVLWLVFRKSNANALKVLDIAKESYRKELETVKLAHEKELAKREEIVMIYQETLKNLEKEHNIKVSELSKKKRREIENLVKNHNENPDAIAEEMKKLFGV